MSETIEQVDYFRKFKNIKKTSKIFGNLKEASKVYGKLMPKIVFFLTLNMRTTRQITRLIKTIYNSYHYYYIHVDKVKLIFAIIFI
jgi:hypothetical protein